MTRSSEVFAKQCGMNSHLRLSSVHRISTANISRSTNQIHAPASRHAQILAMFGFRRSLALSAKGVVNAFEKVGPANRIISSTHREPQRRGLYLTNVLLKKPDGQTSSARLQQDTQKVDVQKGAKKSAGKTSLRRVAVEVERLRRGFIKEKGNKRFVDPDLETKVLSLALRTELSLRVSTDCDSFLRCTTV